jgi:sRNA-binding regulator protein Hfq
MKEALDPTPEAPSLSQDGFANRKLIRPVLTRSDHQHAPVPTPERRERTERPERSDRSNGSAGKKSSPPEQTNAENFYYQKQMQAKTPMVVVLRDGEEIRGVIEWYDKACLKLNRNGGPNLMVYKPAIKYMYKDGER